MNPYSTLRQTQNAILEKGAWYPSAAAAACNQSIQSLDAHDVSFDALVVIKHKEKDISEIVWVYIDPYYSAHDFRYTALLSLQTELQLFSPPQGHAYTVW